MKYTVKLIRDDDAENPVTAWDNFGTFATFHRRVQIEKDKEFSSPDDFLEFLKKEDPICLPVYMYDHSGQTIRTKPFNDYWDSGQLGWIYATKETVCKEFSCKRISKQVREKAESLLRSEVETYDMYMTGDVWGYVIEDEQGNHIDSCWGFFGQDYAQKEAGDALKHWKK